MPGPVKKGLVEQSLVELDESLEVGQDRWCLSFLRVKTSSMGLRDFFPGEAGFGKRVVNHYTDFLVTVLYSASAWS